MGGLKSIGKAFKKLGHSISEGWKDLTDPGRHDRERYTNMLSSESERQAEEKRQAQQLANQITASNNGFLQAYLNQLDRQPQIAYNQGVSELQRQAANSNAAIYKALGRRGITSGVDVKALANNQSYLAKGISALQGQRALNEANNSQLKYNSVANENNNILNRWIYATNNGASPMSDTTQQQLAYYQNRGNRGGAFNNVLSTVVTGALTGGLGTGGIIGNAVGGLLGNKVSSALNNNVSNNNMTLDYRGYVPTSYGNWYY